MDIYRILILKNRKVILYKFGYIVQFYSKNIYFLYLFIYFYCIHAKNTKLKQKISRKYANDTMGGLNA